MVAGQSWLELQFMAMRLRYRASSTADDPHATVLDWAQPGTAGRRDTVDPV
jgi:hypothetical protein